MVSARPVTMTDRTDLPVNGAQTTDAMAYACSWRSANSADASALAGLAHVRACYDDVRHCCFYAGGAHGAIDYGCDDVSSCLTCGAVARAQVLLVRCDGCPSGKERTARRSLQRPSSACADTPGEHSPPSSHGGPVV